jgi:hypothetical protein
MCLGIGHAFVEQPGVQLFQAADPKPECEEAFPHQPHLVLDPPLLPAGGRGAGHRIDQEVAAHLQEAPIVVPLLAAEDSLDRRLCAAWPWTGGGSRLAVVNSARAGALEEGNARPCASNTISWLSRM